MGLVIPKIYIENIQTPLIFLAGPIRGAPNWQDEAAEIIFSREPNLDVISPRRGVNDKILKYLANGRNDFFPRQRAWERHYLDLSKRKGCVMFWLPGEIEHNCEKSYGAMTRLELGQLMTDYRHDNSTRFCVGSDGNFSELDTIVYDLALDAPDKRISPTLEETCTEAIKIAKS